MKFKMIKCKNLIILLSLILFSGCYTSEERKAVDFLKSQMKVPSSFKVLSIKSEKYTYSNEIKYDTIFYNTQYKDLWKCEVGRSQKFFFEDERMKLNQKYDSIVVTKTWYKNNPTTEVNIKYQSNNLFNAPLEGYESIMVIKTYEDIIAMFRIDSWSYMCKEEKTSYKFDEFQIYK